MSTFRRVFFSAIISLQGETRYKTDAGDAVAAMQWDRDLINYRNGTDVIEFLASRQTVNLDTDTAREFDNAVLMVQN